MADKIVLCFVDFEVMEYALTLFLEIAYISSPGSAKAVCALGS